MTESGAKSSKEDLSKEALSKEALSKEDLNEVIVDLDPSDENSNKIKRRLLLRRFWQSAFGFWSKTRGERRAWFLTGLILILVLLNLAASFGMNIWNREIFDALEKHDSSRVLFIALIYFPLLAASVCITIAQVYGKMTMQRRWRAWLTHHMSLNNLAALLGDKGDLAGAEPLYRRALAASEKVQGREHPNTAVMVNNLGGLLRKKSDFSGAEPLYRRALAIRERSLGAEHPDTARSLDNLANLLAGEGNYAGAELLYRRALAIREKVLGPKHPDTATSLNNLAVLLTSKGDYTEAETLCRRALAVSQAVFGSGHNFTGTSLNTLGALLKAKGDYAGAEPLFREALAIHEKTLGRDHPDTGVVLNNLAQVLWAEDQRTEARDLFGRASSLQASNLSRWLVPLEEVDQKGFVQSLNSVDVLISFHLNQPQDKQAEQQALWALLQRKGRLEEIQALQRGWAKRQPELFNRWQLVQHAVHACLEPGEEPESLPLASPAKRRCGSDDSGFLERQQLANTALLSLYASMPRSQQDVGNVGFQELQGVLRDGGWALVEIADYMVYSPKRPQNENWGPHRYVAYVLFADGRIESKDLGEADRINEAVANVRRLDADPTSSIGAVRGAAKKLYELTLAQIEQLLKGQNKLYMAADGDLGLVDFSSLVDRDGRWFIEEHLVVNLTSGRDLVRLERTAAETKGTHGDYLVANPSFLFRNARMTRGSSDQAGSTKQTLGSPTVGCSVTFGKGGSWPRVGITAQEIAEFRTALPGLKVYEKEQASESVVKQIARPRTLWFITHGFFCENVSTGGIPKEMTERRWDDPMLRGALVLAGAQVGGVGDGEDGYLQSAEIVDRDWQGAELAVLGACETALGVPSIGDGVYGMRRAFIVAGVRSQVMTLWRVSQAPTFELLEAFANFLHAGKGKAEALREAQRQMLRKYPHPYYWAGFHFTGDPAPLPAN